jgi:hypothetical protein
MEEINEERIFGALRSVYRYKEMTDESVPEILIETEADLLKRRFALLSAAEIYTLIALWPDYLTEQATIKLIDEQEFENHLLTLN